MKDRLRERGAVSGQLERDYFGGESRSLPCEIRGSGARSAPLKAHWQAAAICPDPGRRNPLHRAQLRRACEFNFSLEQWGAASALFIR